MSSKPSVIVGIIYIVSAQPPMVGDIISSVNIGIIYIFLLKTTNG